MAALRFVVPALVLFGTAGCSLYTRRVLSIDPSVREPTLPDSVRVLAQEPSYSYKVVAIATVAPAYSEGRATLPRLRWELVKEAARLGGNGVLLIPEPLLGASLTGRVIVFDSLAPPVVPTAKPSRASAIPAILSWGFLGAGTVMAIIAMTRGNELAPPTLN